MGSLTSGDLRGRVDVQRKANADDGYGNKRGAWATIHQGIPAKIAIMKGKEEVRAQRLASVSAVEIHVRATPITEAILPSDRLINARTGRAYDIRHIGDLEGLGRSLLITAEVVR
ncbi:head-tail adaptor protein [Brevundimonas sp.]|uniref:head-tail adaptor protein n=1 Tax=Brevundimonas sp. TaxID=1871086 RepID=UPI0035ADEC9E